MIKVLGLVGLLAGSLVLGSAGVVEAACARVSDRDSAGRLCGGRSAEMRGPTTGYDGWNSGGFSGSSSSSRAPGDRGPVYRDSSGAQYYRAGSSARFHDGMLPTIFWNTASGLIYRQGTTQINLSKSPASFDWNTGKIRLTQYDGNGQWIEMRGSAPKSWYDKNFKQWMTHIDGTNYPTTFASVQATGDYGMVIRGTVIAGGMHITYGEPNVPALVDAPTAPVIQPDPVVSAPKPVTSISGGAGMPPVYKPAPVPAKVVITPAHITGKATFKMLTNSAPWKTCTGNGVYSGFGGYTSTAQEVKFTGRTCGKFVEATYTWKGASMAGWFDRTESAFTGVQL